MDVLVVVVMTTKIKSKSARFPARVEKQRKAALIRREVNVKQYNQQMSTEKLPEEILATLTVKLEKAAAEIATLKKHLRIV